MVKFETKGLVFPAILVTGFNSPETGGRGKKAGAAGNSRKPIEDYTLLDSMQWALAKRSPKQGYV
jgi:FixJ family two-component response regulator